MRANSPVIPNVVRILSCEPLEATQYGKPLRDEAAAVGHGSADESLEHVVESHRNTEFIYHRREDTIGDEFAIDQHAVAIENDA